jgi:nucleoid-associated protein YgaU
MSRVKWLMTTLLAVAAGSAVAQARPAAATPQPVRPANAAVKPATQAPFCPEQSVDLTPLQADLALPAEEVLEQAWRCVDQDGEHMVTVSLVRNPGQRATQLLFTQRTRMNGHWRKAWQARDFLVAPVDPTQSARNQVLLKDADGDGRMEAYIAYVLPGPSQSVDEGKLLVFSRGKKYAIRGAIPRSPDDFGSRQIGSAFQELPGTVQSQALSLWDQLSKPRPWVPIRSGRL